MRPITNELARLRFFSILLPNHDVFFTANKLYRNILLLNYSSKCITRLLEIFLSTFIRLYQCFVLLSELQQLLMSPHFDNAASVALIF